MNRRDFLRKAATASVGASGLIILPSESAQSLLETGGATLEMDDIKTEGQIITAEDMLDEIVDLSQLGDNLANILVHSRGAVTFQPFLGDRWRVYGEVSPDSTFKQDGKYKLAHGDSYNNVGLRHR